MGAARERTAPTRDAARARSKEAAARIVALALALAAAAAGTAACAGGGPSRPAPPPPATRASDPLDPTAQQIAALPDAEVFSRDGVVTVTWPADLLFAEGHPEIQPDGADRLRAFAARVTAYPDPVLRVKAHTDVDGSESYSLALSEDRAERVRALLVDAGLSPVRVGAAGFGGEFPVASNDTDEGRARNRRLEIEIAPSAASYAAPAAPDPR